MKLASRALNSARWRLFYATRGVRAWWAGISTRSAPLNRELLSYRYIRGEGIEIGALNHPLRVGREARVRYVDRLDVSGLDGQYRELQPGDMVKVDIVDDGETLATVPDSSQDFVIANHFLEHCQDPLATLGNMVRVLKQNGILYLAIPEKRFTFDRRREPTPLAHLIEDHESGPEASRRGHFEEWVRLVQGFEGEKVDAQVRALMEKDYSIHFHVWSQLELLELLQYAMRRFTLQLEAFTQHGMECIIVLRRIPAWDSGSTSEPGSDAIDYSRG